MTSVIDLVQQLLAQANTEATEFNELYDQLEEANNKLTQLHLENESLKESLEGYQLLKEQTDQIYHNAEKHMTMLKQANRERDQMEDKLAIAKEQVAAYKAIGTPKKIRDRIKAYQTKAAQSVKDIDAVKKLSKGYHKEALAFKQTIAKLQESEAQANMATVWSENGDNLMLFPSRLTMQIGDMQEKQLTLLYMDKSGCGKLIALDENGEPTICKTPAGGLRPKKLTVQIAGEILRKWRRQGWKVTVDDLNLQHR